MAGNLTNNVSIYNETLYQYDDDLDYDGDFYYENIENLRKPWVSSPHFIPLVSVYGTVFLLGIAGNGIVILSVFGGRNSRSVTFTFIVSLAVADLLFLLVVIPHDVLRMVLGQWSGGRSYCKISGFIEMLTAVSSILNLAAVGFERYFVIVEPIHSRRRCTLGNTRKVLVALWGLAILLSSPAFYVRDTQSSTFHNNVSSVTLLFCADTGLQGDHRIYFAIYQLHVMFIVPTVLMVYCYSRVIYTLWISNRTLLNMTSNYRLQNGASPSFQSLSPNYTRRKPDFAAQLSVRDCISKGRRQVIKMLVTIVLVFLLCWGPKLIFNVMKYSDLEKYQTELHFRLQIVLYCLPYIQSCLNPVIYGFMSKTIRQSFKTSLLKHVNRCASLFTSRQTAYESELRSKYTPGLLEVRTSMSDRDTRYPECSL